MRKLDEAQKERIRNLVADRLCVDTEVIDGDTRLKEDLNSDSLDNIEILMDLEKEFNINISDDDFEGVKTLMDVYEVVDLYL